MKATCLSPGLHAAAWAGMLRLPVLPRGASSAYEAPLPTTDPPVPVPAVRPATRSSSEPSTTPGSHALSDDASVKAPAPPRDTLPP
jgi:hypothetical protein